MKLFALFVLAATLAVATAEDVPSRQLRTATQHHATRNMESAVAAGPTLDRISYDQAVAALREALAKAINSRGGAKPDPKIEALMIALGRSGAAPDPQVLILLKALGCSGVNPAVEVATLKAKLNRNPPKFDLQILALMQSLNLKATKFEIKMEAQPSYFEVARKLRESVLKAIRNGANPNAPILALMKALSVSGGRPSADIEPLLVAVLRSGIRLGFEVDANIWALHRLVTKPKMEAQHWPFLKAMEAAHHA